MNTAVASPPDDGKARRGEEEADSPQPPPEGGAQPKTTLPCTDASMKLSNAPFEGTDTNGAAGDGKDHGHGRGKEEEEEDSEERWVRENAGLLTSAISNDEATQAALDITAAEAKSKPRHGWPARMIWSLLETQGWKKVDKGPQGDNCSWRGPGKVTQFDYRRDLVPQMRALHVQQSTLRASDNDYFESEKAAEDYAIDRHIVPSYDPSQSEWWDPAVPKTLVGLSVLLMWSTGKIFKGSVTQYKKGSNFADGKGRHRVIYEDGDKRWHQMLQETFCVVVSDHARTIRSKWKCERRLELARIEALDGDDGDENELAILPGGKALGGQPCPWSSGALAGRCLAGAPRTLLQHRRTNTGRRARRRLAEEQTRLARHVRWNGRQQKWRHSLWSEIINDPNRLTVEITLPPGLHGINLAWQGSKQTVKLGKTHVWKRVSIYWPEDGQSYSGLIVKFDEDSGKHLVRYDDGDLKEYAMSKRQFMFLGGHGPLGGAPGGTSVVIQGFSAKGVGLTACRGKVKEGDKLVFVSSMRDIWHHPHGQQRRTCTGDSYLRVLERNAANLGEIQEHKQKIRCVDYYAAGGEAAKRKLQLKLKEMEERAPNELGELLDDTCCHSRVLVFEKPLTMFTCKYCSYQGSRVNVIGPSPEHHLTCPRHLLGRAECLRDVKNMGMVPSRTSCPELRHAENVLLRIAGSKLCAEPNLSLLKDLVEESAAQNDLQTVSWSAVVDGLQGIDGVDALDATHCRALYRGQQAQRPGWVKVDRPAKRQRRKRKQGGHG